MAKLGPDDQDIEWLEDVNDFDAFSHVLYDQNGVGGQRQVCFPVSKIITVNNIIRTAY